MTPSTVDAEGTVTGNTYDKYGSTNPVVRRLMAGFERTLDELLRQGARESLLDVGCGEGVLASSGPGASPAASSGSTSRTLTCRPSGPSARCPTSSTGS